jgi:1,4-alpha-glucan branching enzyme
MQGYLSLVLHAHLPFVRHPEHERFLEENWLFEAITETYVPLLQVLESWSADGMKAPITLTLTPTLCAMLMDPLLQSRYGKHLDRLIDLADKEVHRTLWEKPFHELALFYLERFHSIRGFYDSCHGDLIGRAADGTQTATLHAPVPGP